MQALAAEAYVAPPWLPGGNLQTLYTAAFLRGPDIEYRRERWEWPDGDFVDADWVDANQPDAPIVVLFHGLEGSSQSFYARDLMHTVKQRGWRGVVPHFRGCSGEPNRLPRAYFAGDTAEIEAMLRRVKSAFPEAPLYAVGVSLGGNAVLKWLGDAGNQAATLVRAAAGVSAPLDMNAAGHALDRGLNRAIYTSHFLLSLKRKALDKAERFPGLLDQAAIEAATTFQEYDTLVTARLHGYLDAEDYWTRTSSKPGLKNIVIPTLVINAKNDPFLPASALPTPDGVSTFVTLEQPEEGGHVAFPSGPFPGNIDWLPARILDFFDAPHV
ncbi:MAG: alpha/beta fold hydrolase [Hydrogenophilaceae bacterium]|nr:alpha/beta fold hydrolase [Hydrogenophilaceae bacterium]